MHKHAPDKLISDVFWLVLFDLARSNAPLNDNGNRLCVDYDSCPPQLLWLTREYIFMLIYNLYLTIHNLHAATPKVKRVIELSLLIKFLRLFSWLIIIYPLLITL